MDDEEQLKEEMIIYSFTLFWIHRPDQNPDMGGFKNLIFDVFFGKMQSGQGLLFNFKLTKVSRQDAAELRGAVNIWNSATNNNLKQAFFGNFDEGVPGSADVLVNFYKQSISYHTNILAGTKTEVESSIRSMYPPYSNNETTEKMETKIQTLKGITGYADLWEFINQNVHKTPKKTVLTPSKHNGTQHQSRPQWNTSPRAGPTKSTRSRSTSIPHTNPLKKFSEVGVIASYLLYFVYGHGNNGSQQMRNAIFDAFAGNNNIPRWLMRDIKGGLNIWGSKRNEVLKNGFFDNLEKVLPSRVDAITLVASFARIQDYHQRMIFRTKSLVRAMIKNKPDPNNTNHTSAKLTELKSLEKYGEIWDFIERQKLQSLMQPKRIPIEWAKQSLVTESPAQIEPRATVATKTSMFSTEPQNTKTAKKTVRISEPVVYSYMLWFLSDESPETILDAFYNQTTNLKNNIALKREIREGLDVWNWRRNIDIKNEFVRQFYPDGVSILPRWGVNLDADDLINAFSSMSYHTRVMTSTKQQIIEMHQSEPYNGEYNVSELNSYSSLWRFITTKLPKSEIRTSNLQQDDHPARKSPWTGKNPSKPYPSNMTQTRKSS
jgi:hypothetical protein